jgi:hypothetical protein
MEKEVSSLTKKLKKEFPEYNIQVFWDKVAGMYTFEGEETETSSIRPFYSWKSIRKVNFSDFKNHVDSEIQEGLKFIN